MTSLSLSLSPSSSPSPAFPWRLPVLARRAEDLLIVAALAITIVLPVLEWLLRTLFVTGVAGSTIYVQNLTLWVGFLGAALASRESNHLSLSTAKFALPGVITRIAGPFSAAISTAVAAGLFWGSLQFVLAEAEAPEMIGGWLPVWVAEAVLPAAFALIGLRFVMAADGWRGRAVAVSGVALAAVFGFVLEPFAAELVWPAMAGVVVAALLGAPIFVLLGGVALILFFADGVPTAAISVEIHRIIGSPLIPTIPLFTLTGYLLAEGGAGTRLVRLFRAVFGWIPGGTVIATTLVCAFFTTFTGASGVTIVALGGLLLPVLVKNQLSERFSLGLLTSTGSIGLLFPPSLAVILYAVVAHVPIVDLFQVAVIPGVLMVGAIALFGIRESAKTKAPRPRFDRREAAEAIRESKWEILLPMIVLVGVFGGVTTLIEAAAITVVYALVVETVIHRDLDIVRDIPRVLLKSSAMIGGIFIILGVAMGLTNYIVDAEVPMLAADWVRANVDSRFLFLFALNVFLLLVGCLMDIFSAIVVAVPLILPIAEAFGIHPLHLAVIFLVNLELGYLTPPVGMNVLLASYRFDKPLVEVYRSTLPFFAVLLVVLMIVTYVPMFTLYGG